MATPHRFAKGRVRPKAGMNKTEAAYEAHLALRKAAGEVQWYAYEGVKLRLADKTFYTPDFVVMLADDVIELHEVKGAKGAGYWCEEDAKIKVKVAAAAYPFQFRIVWNNKAGWQSEAL